MLDIRDKFDFMGDGFTGTATKNSTTDHDYKIMDDAACLNGAEIIYASAAFGDYVQFQIVDKDNVLGYGANTILSTYVRKWYVDPARSTKKVVADYAGSIPKNVYVRVKYTSVGTVSDVSIAINLFLHKVK